MSRSRIGRETDPRAASVGHVCWPISPSTSGARLVFGKHDGAGGGPQAVTGATLPRAARRRRSAVTGRWGACLLLPGGSAVAGSDGSETGRIGRVERADVHVCPD